MSYYRYGFNGKEKDVDGEWGENTTAYDYGFRVYNPSIGKFLSVDPLMKSYPHLTPYQFASNSPIQAIDLDGLESFRVIYYEDSQNTVSDISITLLNASDEFQIIRNNQKLAHGYIYNNDDGSTYIRRQYSSASDRVVEDNFFKFLRDRCLLLTGTTKVCTIGVNCPSGSSTPQLLPSKQISPIDVSGFTLRAKVDISVPGPGPPPPGPPPPHKRVTLPVGVDIHNPLQGVLNATKRAPVRVTAGFGWDAYTQSIVNDLKNNPELSVNFIVPGLHDGNNGKWSDYMTGGSILEEKLTTNFMKV